MLANNEQALERLVVLSDENENLDGAQVLDLWRKERTEARQKSKRALEDAMRVSFDEQPWYIKRVEVGPVWQPEIKQNVMRDVRVEEFVILQKDLPTWTKERGLKLDDLMSVLNLRVREVRARGKRYQSNHPRQMFIDRREPQELVGQSLAESMPMMEYK